MRTFTVNSFWQTFLWMVRSERGQMYTWVFAVAIIIALVQEGILAITRGGADIALTLSLTIVVAGAFFAASQTFVAMKRKQTAITLLMHPASPMEKYAGRLLYCTVILGLTTLAGLLIGDTARYFFNQAVGWHIDTTDAPLLISGGRRFWQMLSEGTDFIDREDKRMLAVSMLTYVWCHSLYVLGSAFFRRHRFLLTTTVFIVLEVIIAQLSGDFGHFTLGLDRKADLTAWCFVYGSIHLVLAVVNYWAAYKLFTRMQVINNRWINI